MTYRVLLPAAMAVMFIGNVAIYRHYEDGCLRGTSESPISDVCESAGSFWLEFQVISAPGVLLVAFLGQRGPFEQSAWFSRLIAIVGIGGFWLLVGHFIDRGRLRRRSLSILQATDRQ